MTTSGFRCVLFVPGNRPERFEKALATAADRVCVDLEDAVADDAKDTARQAALATIAGFDDAALVGRLGIRINAPDTPEGNADLEGLADSGVSPAFVMVPKFESMTQINRVTERLGTDCPPLIVLVETARGLLDLDFELESEAPLEAVMFGGYDFSVDMECAFGWEPLLYARSRIATLARAYDIAAIDVPWLDIRDDDGLARETAAVRDLGFSAKAAIHPAQVDTIQNAFTPSSEAIEQAREIVAAAEASEGNAVQLEGRLIDAPVIAAARRTLTRIDRTNL